MLLVSSSFKISESDNEKAYFNVQLQLRKKKRFVFIIEIDVTVDLIVFLWTPNCLHTSFIKTLSGLGRTSLRGEQVQDESER